MTLLRVLNQRNRPRQRKKANMRVISGKYRSRPLKAVPGKHTRPTTDKIKESLFNLLPPMTHQRYCLDFYGGTGSLAIEAVSRGFDHAVICERDRQAIQTIHQNIEMTKEPELFTVLKGNNQAQLKKYHEIHPDRQYDLVFLDPPYALEHYLKDIALLEQLMAVHQDTVIVCESDREVELPSQIGSYVLMKQKQYGQTILWIYRQEEL